MRENQNSLGPHGRCIPQEEQAIKQRQKENAWPFEEGQERQPGSVYCFVLCPLFSHQFSYLTSAETETVENVEMTSLISNATAIFWFSFHFSRCSFPFCFTCSSFFLLKFLTHSLYSCLIATSTSGHALAILSRGLLWIASQLVLWFPGFANIPYCPLTTTFCMEIPQNLMWTTSQSSLNCTAPLKDFFVTSLLKHNPCIMKFSLLMCIIPWSLVYSKSFATITAL